MKKIKFTILNETSGKIDNPRLNREKQAEIRKDLDSLGKSFENENDMKEDSIKRIVETWKIFDKYDVD